MAKAIWKGSIAFGLVNIPVKMYSAVSSNKLDLDMLDKSDHGAIQYKRVNKDTGKEVEWEDIVKGYKIGDRYVVLEKEDFEKASVEKTKRIEIKSFVAEKEINPIYYDKTYFLEPDKGNPQPYILLRNALNQSKMVGLGSFVLRNRESLCVIKVYEHAIVLTKIHYEQDIRKPEDLQIPKEKAKQNAAELKMATTLIKNMQQPFDISAYKDEYTEQLLHFIQQKAKGKAAPKSKTSKPLPKEVSNLMEQLKASLNEPTKKTPAKKKASTRKTTTKQTKKQKSS